MPHVVTVRAHETNPDLLYLCTPPELASVMGGFGPARFVGRPPWTTPDASYLIATDDLVRFQTFANSRQIITNDARGVVTEAPAQRPAWAERPLPECRECGQPAKRGARLTYCPNCGQPWDAIEIGAPETHHHEAGVECPHCVKVHTCTGCHLPTPYGFAHCVHCGSRTGAHEEG